MKAKRLDEVRAFLASDSFRGWWVDLAQAREAQGEATRRYEAVLEEATLAEFRAELTQKNAIDTLYASGECEDDGARLIAEASAVENEAMEALAAYEEQRFKASDAWFRLGAIDKSVEELKERLASAKARADGRAEAHKIEAELQKVQREQRSAHETYERESGRKSHLWDTVEGRWGRSMELSLVCAEKQARSLRIRQDAEALFRTAEAHKQEAERLRAEAESLSRERERLEGFLDGLFAHAREKFECIVGDDFLYWGARANDKTAWCVSLISDDRSYNMEVAPLSVYRVTVKEGVRRLDPLPPEGVEAGAPDERIDAWFLGGRAGGASGTSKGGQ